MSLVIGCQLLVTQASADTFDPNNIISDNEVLDYNSMTIEGVKEFLATKGSFLATYSVANPDGKIMTGPEIIYDRAITNKISPKFILVLLQNQMENRLIKEKN